MICRNCGEVDTKNENGICTFCSFFPIKRKDEEREEIGKRGQEIGSPKALCFNNAEYNYLDPNTIWSFRQNIPELVVQDCIKEFNLDDEQAEKLRIILMARGVNKWMLARREFIDLKHQVKEMLKGAKDDKKVHRVIQKIYVRMQNIARMQRWVEWPRSVTHKWKNIEKDIKKKGKHC